MKHKIVRFANDSDRYYDYTDQQLHMASGEAIKSKLFRRYERILLELLVDHHGIPVSRDMVIEAVKESKISDTEPPYLKSVDNHILNLRKLIDIPLGIAVIESVHGVGYRYIGIAAESDVPQKERRIKNIPALLTKTTAPHMDGQNVIHRSSNVAHIMERLSRGDTVILLSGFGGVGKTSLAQMLYTKIAEDLDYDDMGWVEYHGNLKNSLTTAIELEEEITDQEKRWMAVAKRLKDKATKKILFIDNVDRDVKQNQDPTNDPLLREITGWPGLTLVLTSRIQEIPPFHRVAVNYLGSISQMKPCVDLFYFYYDQEVYNSGSYDTSETQIVEELVKRAGFHTYAIELLAKSAVYEDSLACYLRKIEEIGFQFPTLAVMTNYHAGSARAARQLQLLFNLRTRGEKEQQVLWDFSVLPEGISLTSRELEHLLAYSQNDLHCLVQDSWLQHRRGQGFSIHPLVREIVHFDLEDGYAPIGTVERLVDLTVSGTLITADDSQPEILRKLGIIENAAPYLRFVADEEAGWFYFNLGIAEYNFARKRLTSIRYLMESLQRYRPLQMTDSWGRKDCIAELKYQLGYIKSATHRYRAEAKYDLQEALDIWLALADADIKAAKAHDHLGYVLSDSSENYWEAEGHLKEALRLRRKFYEQEPTIENLRAYATTCDNLGFLLSKYMFQNPSDFQRAYNLLFKALEIRERVYAETNCYETDVAWTAFNLGVHLSKQQEAFEEAESLFKRALEIRREQERRQPGTFANNILFTIVALAKLIANNPKRLEEVRALTAEAIQIKANIDPEHAGYFSDEVEEDLIWLVNIT